MGLVSERASERTSERVVRCSVDGTYAMERAQGILRDIDDGLSRALNHIKRADGVFLS